MVVFLGPGTLGGAMGSSTLADPPAPDLSSTTTLVPNLHVTINGAPVQATLLGASITYGFDVGIATATVDFAYGPNVSGQPPIDPTHTLDGLQYMSVVQIFCGSEPASPNYNTLRFTGVYLRTEADMWPHIFHLVCKGILYRAAQYYLSYLVGNPSVITNQLAVAGTPLTTLTNEIDGSTINGYYNGTLNNATDSKIVLAILQSVPGLTGYVTPSNIRGTIDLPLYSPTGALIRVGYLAAVWPPYRSAWEQIQIFDQVFIGFRTYEGLGGQIYRSQIFGYPSGTADTTFTEGVDIWEASGMRTVEPLVNAAYVEGNSDTFNTGGQFISVFVQSSNPIQGGSIPIVDRTSSPFIEASNFIDSTGFGGTRQPGLHADDVASWRLSERNRELVNIQLTTWRDDPMYIGHTIAVDIPHAAVTEPVWIQRVEIRVQNQPALFQQTIYGIGGGLANYQPGLVYPVPPGT